MPDVDVTNLRLPRTWVTAQPNDPLFDISTDELDDDIRALGDVNWGANKLTNVLDPTLAQDVSTKNYVDTSNVQNFFDTAGAGLTSTGSTVNAVGTPARITVNANDIDIASTYVGQLSIITLGTITTGVWNGTSIANGFIANLPTLGTLPASPRQTAILTAEISDNQVTFAKIQNIATNSLIGRDTAATGDPEQILLNATLEFDGALNLRRAALTGDVTAPAGSNAMTYALLSIVNADISATAGIVNSKLVDIATARILGRVTAATGVREELTGTQATTLLDTFTSALKGLAPGSGGGTTNFLRADGTWAVPPGGSTLPVVDTTSIVEGSADATKELRFEVDGNTTGIIGVIATVFTTAKTITVPDATDTLVARATTDTLTNKTIDGDDNTIVDINETQMNVSVGAATTVLTSNGVGVAPSYAAPAGGEFTAAWTADHNQGGSVFGLRDALFVDPTVTTKKVQIDLVGMTAAVTAILDFNFTTAKTLTFPDATDTLVGKATTDIFTNKSIDANGTGNVITNIGDAETETFTTTKISTTNKALLNSNIVYTDQANIMGDFNFQVKDNQFRIENPAGTFEYQFIGAAIVADRTLTLPLLTAPDTMVTEAFTQTLTNKTMDGDLNTFVDINETQMNVSVGASTTVLTSNGVGVAPTYQAPAGGEFTAAWTADHNQTGSGFALQDARFADPTDATKEIRLTLDGMTTGIVLTIDTNQTTAQTLTIPNTTGADDFVLEDFTQTLTNKTIAAGSNTISGLSIDGTEVGRTVTGGNLILASNALEFNTGETISVQASDMIFDVTTGDFFSFDIAGVPEVTISNTQMDLTGMNLVNAVTTSTVTGVSGITGLGAQAQTLDMNNNTITLGTGLLNFLTAGTSISEQSSDIIFDVSTGDIFSFDIAGVPEVTISASQMDLTGLSIVNATIDGDLNTLVDVNETQMNVSVGAATTVLTSNGVGSAPSYAAPAGGEFTAAWTADHNQGGSVFGLRDALFVDPTVTTKKVQIDLVGMTAAVTAILDFNFTTAKTLTFPDATDTLVGKATTDIFTNKDILSTTNRVDIGVMEAPSEAEGDIFFRNATVWTRLPRGADNQVLTATATTINWEAAGAASLPVVDTTSIAEGSGDATKEVRFEVDGNTTGIIGVLATAFTTAKTVTFPDATDTLVAEAFAATLTNKTMDANNNTFSNFEIGNEVSATLLANLNFVDFDLTAKPTPNTDFFEILVETTAGDDVGAEPVFHINARRDTPASLTQRGLFEISNNDLGIVQVDANGDWSFFNHTLELGTGNLEFTINQTITGSGPSITYAVGTGDTHVFNVNGIRLTLAETLITSTVPIRLGTNALEFNTATESISIQAGDMIFDITGSDFFSFDIAGASEMTLTSNQLDLKTNEITTTGKLAISTGTMRMPLSAAPTMAVDGDFAIDTDLGANFSHGFIKYFDGEEAVVVSMPVAEFGSPSDGEAVTYNATTDEFELRATGGGVQTPWASTIDAADFSLQNLDILNFNTVTDTPVAGAAEIWWNSASSMFFNVPTGDTFAFTVQGDATPTLTINNVDVALQLTGKLRLDGIGGGEFLSAGAGTIDIFTSTISRLQVADALITASVLLNMQQNIIDFSTDGHEIVPAATNLTIRAGGATDTIVMDFSGSTASTFAGDVTGTTATAGNLRLPNAAFISWDNIGTGNSDISIDANDDFLLRIDGTTEMTLSATALDVQNNAIDIGTGLLRFSNVNQNILGNTGGIEYDCSAAPDTHEFLVGGGSQLIINDTSTALGAGKTLVIQGTGATGFIDIDEITTPASPAANVVRLHVKDVGGNSHIFQDNSTESPIDLTTGSAGEFTAAWTANHNNGGSAFALEDARFADPTDDTKTIQLNLAGMTTAIELTISTSQTTNQTLTIPNLTGAATMFVTPALQTLVMSNNNIEMGGSGVIQFADSTESISIQTGDMVFDVPTTDIFSFDIAGVPEYTFSPTTFDATGASAANLAFDLDSNTLTGSTAEFNTALQADTFFFISNNISNMATSTSAQFDTANSDGTFFLNADNIADMATSTSAEFDAANSDGTFFLNADNISAMATSTAAQFDTANSDENFAYEGQANTWGTDDQNIAATGEWQEGGVAISPIGVHDIPINATGMYATTTLGATGLTQTELPTNDVDIQTWDFTSTTADERVQFSTPLPRNYNNAAITVSFTWSQSSGTGNVVWRVGAVAAGQGEAIDQAFVFSADVVDAGGTANQYQQFTTASFTPGGTPADANQMHFEVMRQGTDSLDTFTGTARLHSIVIHMTTDAATAA